jgi:putative transcriptional regulator
MTKTYDQRREHQNEINRRAMEGDLHLPEAVAFIREGLGWSPEYFAEKFHITVQQLEAIENGEMGELFEALRRIGKPWGFEITYMR